MRRYFILTTKKCRIYAAFGVSQTPKNGYDKKEKSMSELKPDSEKKEERLSDKEKVNTEKTNAEELNAEEP